jgi:hypothetical protein
VKKIDIIKTYKMINANSKIPIISQLGTTAVVGFSDRQSKRVAKLLVLCTIAALFFSTSCKKFIDVAAPPNQISDQNIYNADATAISVLTGIYTNMSQQLGAPASIPFYGSITTSSFFSGLYSDELILDDKSVNLNLTKIYENDLLESDGSVLGFWFNAYNQIFTANAAYNGVKASNSLSLAVKQQLMGEALFIRAFCYLYLVDYYGEVPLPLTTDYKVNASLPRSSTSVVYQQIISDLKEARGLLSADFLAGNVITPVQDRLRPTKWAATALLARAYLYSGDNANAEIEATRMIDNHTQFDMAGIALNDVFKKNSPETIWALTKVGFAGGVNDPNTGFAQTFVLPSGGPQTPVTPINPFYLSDYLMNAFEAADNRKAQWTGEVTANGITYPYAYKYKVNALNQPLAEYSIVMRMGEQYLIRAEARARQNKFIDAKADLNAIRARAGLPNTTAADADLLDAVLHERQVELFTEWGDRFSSLKRINNNIDEVMPAVCTAKGGAWQPYKKLLPLPFEEIRDNPSIAGHQNQGY